jgi:hypothetical protein
MRGEAVDDFHDQGDRRNHAMPEAEQELRQRAAGGGMLGLLGPSDTSGQSNDGYQPDNDDAGSFHAFLLARPAHGLATSILKRDIWLLYWS